MNGLLLASEPQNKDIKFDPKKIADIDKKNIISTGDFFEELMGEILSDIPDTEKKSFFLSKILNLPENIGKNEEIRSLFSDEPLFTNHQIENVSVETLVEIASLLKTTPQQPHNFPTDSDTLKVSLLDLEVQKSFKNARTIGDLLKIAEKNGIKVKNFEFFKEDLALDTLSKQMVHKVKSEEIFRLMEREVDKKMTPRTHRTAANIKIVPSSETSSKNVLKDILTTQQNNKPSQKKRVSLHSTMNKKEKQQIKAVKSDETTTNISHKTENIKTQQTKVTSTDRNIEQYNKIQKTDQTLSAVLPDTNKASGKTGTEHIPLKNEVHTTDTHIEKILQNSDKQTKTTASNNTLQAYTKDIDNKQTHISSLHDTENIDTKIDSVTQDKNHPKQIESEKHTKVQKTDQTTTPLSSETEKAVQNPKLRQQTSVQQINQQKILSEAKSPISDTTLKAQPVTPEQKYTFSTTSKNISESGEPENIKRAQTGTIMRDVSQEQTFSASEKESGENITVSHETKSQHTTQVKQEQNDIKRTFHTFAEEFRERVESYKPPLMKIKMQLNPGNLGDVDVTLINRGNNLHVNINSSASTIALFAQNQAEFRNALVNMGFTGLQMNFGENREGQRGQQNKNDNHKNSRPDTEEAHETDGFEMIVPRYI